MVRYQIVTKLKLCLLKNKNSFKNVIIIVR